MAGPNPFAQRAYSYYIGLGYQPHQAAALAGNAQAESGFRPTVLGDNNQAFGTFQWHGSRQQDLQNYAQRNNLDPKQLETQLGFFDWELKNTERAAGQRLMGAQNVQQANDAVISSLRPAGYKPGNAAGAMHYDKRLGFSQAVLGAPAVGMPTQTASAPPGPAPADPADPAAPAPAAGAPAAGGGGKPSAQSLGKMGSDLLAQSQAKAAQAPNVGPDPGVYMPQVTPYVNPYRKRMQAMAQATAAKKPVGLLGGIDG